MPRAVIALGGNVGDVRQTFRDALPMICDRAEAQLVARSRDYRTQAWGKTDQADFVNACAIIATTMPSLDLLGVLHDVERAHGRDRARETHWGPRTLDLDLIAYDDVRMLTPRLTLPHPRAKLRAFVLKPLNDIAPDLMIDGETVREALARLPVHEHNEPVALSPVQSFIIAGKS